MGADLIAHNPLLKKPVLEVLALADEVADRTALEAVAREGWQPSYPQSPAAVIDMLVRAGALAEQSFVNGEPYAGTLADMQLDESVPDDAVVEVRIGATETGRALAAAYDPARTLRELFADRPAYENIFRAVLAACATDAGADRATVEAVIEAQPTPAAKKVYPQYFIDALESAGGIVWNGAWRLTETGRALIAA